MRFIMLEEDRSQAMRNCAREVIAVIAREPGKEPGTFVHERRDEREMRVRFGGTPDDQESGDIFNFTLATKE